MKNFLHMEQIIMLLNVTLFLVVSICFFFTCFLNDSWVLKLKFKNVKIKAHKPKVTEFAHLDDQN